MPSVLHLDGERGTCIDRVPGLRTKRHGIYICACMTLLLYSCNKVDRGLFGAMVANVSCSNIRCLWMLRSLLSDTVAKCSSKRLG